MLQCMDIRKPDKWRSAGLLPGGGLKAANPPPPGPQGQPQLRVACLYPRRCNDVTAAGAARGATGAAGGRFGDCEWLLAPMTCCVQDNV